MKAHFASKKSKSATEKKSKDVETEAEETPQAPEPTTDDASQQLLIESLLAGSETEEPVKTQLINMYGEVEEEKIGEIVYALRVLSALNVQGKESFEPKEDRPKFEPNPIELVLSTHGGSAADMFSLYDTMRWCRDEGTPIATTGIGKIMSAGVLIMAAGTKGRRKIGENCRVMLHGVASGHVGQIHNLENELDEAKWTQDRYVKALVKETDMTEKYIKKLFDRRQNVYLTAEEAVELGIADEIF